MYPEEEGCEGVDWIHLDNDTDQWGFFVNTVIDLSVPWKGGKSWLAERLLASKEELYSTELRSQ
jgi:hypothetical protein